MKESHAPILLILEGTYPWYRGGVSEWIHQYLKYNPRQLFHIIQIATDEYRYAPIDEALYELPDHVQKFERVSPPELSAEWENELRRWIKNVEKQVSLFVEESSFIHIVNTGFAGWLGKELAIHFKKPLVLTEHALYWKEIMMGAVALECGYKVPEEKREKEAFGKMFRLMAAEIYSISDVIVSVSKSNIPEQQKLGARDVHYIPNGIPASRLKQFIPQQSSTLTIGWIGRCAEMKNPMKFFDVVSTFGEYEAENVEFIMVTCNAGEPELEQRVRTREREFNHLEVIWNRSSEDFIDQMDALCITSHNESQPLVLFEALGRKILPVGWRTGDVTAEYGFILDPEATTGELVQSVLELWKKPQEWLRIVENRFMNVQAHHTWEKIFDHYRSLLLQL
ncbi:Glycosyltransferase involved in cell wall bisynthesis [Fodinibius roseus]|uniref:Glycosyltransferase involved in cell wall bisynthesis n=1 Tax=Fodinibius roseus TaxID=1194090 RepID=A0A1M5CCY4_9BACT|nr:DUF3492 domain-containing protein [Fodinibius roseus]SHF52624.1 Glycosyltransferase involved in cell wall bisynthesis [Fodinibius roseus]